MLPHFVYTIYKYTIYLSCLPKIYVLIKNFTVIFGNMIRNLMLIEFADAIRSNMMAPVIGRNARNIRIIYVPFGVFFAIDNKWEQHVM